MPQDKERDREAIARLTESMIDHIISSNDEEILSESKELYGDIPQAAAQMRALLEKTVLHANKRNLENARIALAQSNVGSEATVLPINKLEARQCYEAFLVRDSDASSKITMAARNGKQQSQRDIDSALSDMAELGAFLKSNKT